MVEKIKQNQKILKSLFSSVLIPKYIGFKELMGQFIVMINSNSHLLSNKNIYIFAEQKNKLVEIIPGILISSKCKPCMDIYFKTIYF